MTIEILPAQLANQIAAGEVVERPASVVKELIENSLDAGATKIHLDIEKGGSKRIRLIDNGNGIAKDQLCLALSRHATSKIKNLDDLENIASLGFRGEALASISAVARLTLTSKPKMQISAWQARAQGRDMQVTVQPAAHPDGTTIDVQDLFFNTPARRKFLRTDKTEFAHIDEVIRRIALSRFDVALTLTHNGKIIRQYQALANKAQYSKRVAKICGQKFIDHALTVHCEHDGIKLWGWIATPSFVRNQNDLAFSYVNDRMMRDKLINHAIRQAYADSLPSEGYPAFVLYLQLDHKEVDVNVHPAKHEVRFHQGRYVHDFIYSVVHQALISAADTSALAVESAKDLPTSQTAAQQSPPPSTQAQTQGLEQGINDEYITPLRGVNDSVHDVTKPSYQTVAHSSQRPNKQVSNPVSHQLSNQVSHSAVQAYQNLLTPQIENGDKKVENFALLYVEKQRFGLFKQAINLDGNQQIGQEREQELRIIDLVALAISLEQQSITQRLAAGLVSQPLLLPIQLQFSEDTINWLDQQQGSFKKAGIVMQIKNKSTVQIRQFPACLRHHDVNFVLNEIIEKLSKLTQEKLAQPQTWANLLAPLVVKTEFDHQSAELLLQRVAHTQQADFNHYIHLNSAQVDLTSVISKLSQ